MLGRYLYPSETGPLSQKCSKKMFTIIDKVIVLLFLPLKKIISNFVVLNFPVIRGVWRGGDGYPFVSIVIGYKVR